MYDKVIDFSLIPITNAHALVMRCRTESTLTVALCFSQVSVSYCIRQFLKDTEENIDTELEIMLSVDQVQILPDFDVNEEVILESSAGGAVSLLIDQLALCDPATLKQEHSRFARRFRVSALSPLPCKKPPVPHLYAPRTVAVIFAKTQPYRVNLIHSKSDLDAVSEEMSRSAIDVEVYRPLLPSYEEVWESSIILDGPAAEAIAFLMWVYDNNLKLEQALVSKQR